MKSDLEKIAKELDTNEKNIITQYSNLFEKFYQKTRIKIINELLKK